MFCCARNIKLSVVHKSRFLSNYLLFIIRLVSDRNQFIISMHFIYQTITSIKTSLIDYLNFIFDFKLLIFVGKNLSFD